MEIIPGVHAVDSLGVGRAYLFQEADRLTLIDAGLAGSAERIFARIEAMGRRVDDLQQIVITHHHGDHTGALADVVERTDAQVMVHPLDAPVVRGERAPPGPNATGFWRLLTPILARGVRPAPAARVDRELADGDEVDLDGGAKVLHVPGHTAGSIALHLPKRKLLFAGDAAVNTLGLGPPSGPFGVFNESQANARESFRRLAELDLDVACFGHGKPLDKDASVAFRRAVERLG